MSVTPQLPQLPLELQFEQLSEAAYFRICGQAHAHSEPSFRASGSYRFDAPDRAYETLYCARDFKTCFFETVVRSNPLANIPATLYDSRKLVFLLLDTARLKLVSMYGTGSQIAGQDQSILASSDYRQTQSLSKAVYLHPSQPDGMVYRSRFDDASLAIVLFGRALPFVRLYPGTVPTPFSEVHELTDAVGAVIPYSVV
jgi:hypothetical protein